MRPSPEPAPVVVAVDDTGTAGDAVDWASAEAAARGCPLRLVNAFRPSPPTVDPYGLAAPVDARLSARMVAESILRAAVARARSVASDVEVSALLLPGAPARVLLDESSRAALLVLGSRGLCGLRGLLARSVAVRVAARASCPVAVVRTSPEQHDRRWSPPRVVVGVDGTASCTLAVAFAFQAARQRGIPLVAVHAWTPDPPADLEAIGGSPTTSEEVGRRKLERALDRWRSEFADVTVVPTLVCDHPAHALLAQSRSAALVVVGSRGRGLVRGTVLGSVSRSVLQHGRGPLVISRQHAPVRGADPAVEPEQTARDDRGSGRRRTPRGRRWAA